MKNRRTLTFIVKVFCFLLVLASISLPLSAQTVPSVLESRIEAAFSPSFGSRTTLPGENLQRIADAAYGTQLLWPFVWYFNREEVADPERVSKGISIKVPQLKAGPDNPKTILALESAYLLVYMQYKTLYGNKPGQRQWVLLQASSTGIDPRTGEWLPVLDPADKTWAQSKVKVAPSLAVSMGVSAVSVLKESSTLTIPKTEDALQSTVTDKVSTASKQETDESSFFESKTQVSPVLVLAPAVRTPAPEVAPPELMKMAGPSSKFGSEKSRNDYLKDILDGTPLPLAEIESWVASLRPEEMDRVIQNLELAASMADAPPQVSFALSLQYRRKGLVQKEYAALVKTQEASVRRPDVIFNVVLLNGRKSLLDSNYRFDELSLGSLAISANISQARIMVNGELWGQGTVRKDKLQKGNYSLRIESEGYQTMEKEIKLQAGDSLSFDLNLVVLPSTPTVRIDKNDVGNFNQFKPVVLPFKKGNRLFLRTNLHHEKREISAANFQLAGLLPLGTEIIVESIDRSRFRFQRVDTKEKFVYEFHKQAGEDLNVHLSRVFSSEPVLLEEERFTALELEQIRAGQMAVGMSRLAVILAIGLPPKVENPELLSTSWRYWIKRFNTTKLVFDQDGILSDIVN